jgi:hypothetical protein
MIMTIENPIGNNLHGGKKKNMRELGKKLTI